MQLKTFQAMPEVAPVMARYGDLRKLDRVSLIAIKNTTGFDGLVDAEYGVVREGDVAASGGLARRVAAARGGGEPAQGERQPLGKPEPLSSGIYDWAVWAIDEAGTPVASTLEHELVVP